MQELEKKLEAKQVELLKHFDQKNVDWKEGHRTEEQETDFKNSGRYYYTQLNGYYFESDLDENMQMYTSKIELEPIMFFFEEHTIHVKQYFDRKKKEIKENKEREGDRWNYERSTRNMSIIDTIINEPNN